MSGAPMFHHEVAARIDRMSSLQRDAVLAHLVDAAFTDAAVLEALCLAVEAVPEHPHISGRTLRHGREACDVTVEELAARLGVEVEVVAGWEAGTVPNVEFMRAMQALGVIA